MAVSDPNKDWRVRAGAAGMFWRCSTTLRGLRKIGDANSESRAEHRRELQTFAFLSEDFPFISEELRRQSAAELAADEAFYGEGPNSAWLWDFDEPEPPSKALPRRRNRRP